MEDPALNNGKNDINSEFKQLKKYNKSEIKNEPARKIKKIKKKININGGTQIKKNPELHTNI
jgi:hypothetical protein